MRRNINIAWPAIRPRSPGCWREILDTTEGVRITSSPESGCVIEYPACEKAITEEESASKGHLGYVEAVFPDQSLQITDVGQGAPGVYTERIVRANEWKTENEPYFLMFS